VMLCPQRLFSIVDHVNKPLKKNFNWT